MNLISCVRFRRRRAVATIATVAAVAGSVLGVATGAQAAYWSSCSTRNGVTLCLYDGHLADGTVKISATVKNVDKVTENFCQFTIADSPWTWDVQGGNFSLAPGDTKQISKVLTGKKTWSGTVRSMWGGAGNGICQSGGGLSHTGTW